MLKDIRVVDLADKKGSFCSRLLADLGASVVKIEKPLRDRFEDVSQDKYSRAYLDANKHSITLDLELAEDRQALLELIRNADVLIETFQPGYLETIGLGYETLQRENPGIIHVSVTGFGKYGPGRMYRSCDLVASASGGQMYIMGDPSGRPCAPFGEQSHYAASLFGAISVLLALKSRTLTGKGTYVDLSFQEAVASTLDHVMVDWFYEKTITRRQGNLYGNSYFCILPCKNGHIQLTLLQQWETFVELLASEGMAGNLADPPWNDETYRTNNILHIIETVGAWTKKHTIEELFFLGQTMRFPWAPICSLEDVLRNPHLEARRFFMPVNDPCNNSTMLYPTLPCTFSVFPNVSIKPAPLPGEHNKAFSEGSLWPRREKVQSVLPVQNNARSEIPKRGILSGVRVLDFTWILAGPYATRILADNGAEVIKIQSTKTAKGAETNTSGYFNTWNRNKRSITLNLSHRESRRIILKLISKSDIVVENFSPRVMSNWELTYNTLKEAKPDLIMTSISAMGQNGPWKDFVGYGPTFHALSGLTAMTSAEQKVHVGLGHAYADTIIGLYAAMVTLVALRHRDMTGEGQYIDVSGYEAICTLMGPALLQACAANTFQPTGTPYDVNVAAAPHGCYRCAGDDKWCVIAVFTEEEWRMFCNTLDNPGWTKEEMFSTLALRRKNHAALDSYVESWTSLHTPETVVDLMRNHGIAASVVENSKDLAHDPCLVGREFFVELMHPVLGKTVSDRSALNFPTETTRQWKAAPLLGEDNRYVFMELLGFSEEEFQFYIKQGVIS